ncbi:MAG: D-alanyl-D-alanine carboxypeptidase [Rickettsiales bacterium]|nr:D-alanyl-D-alanine carboxypeptidase [Rickettsiales bacterium]
MRRLIFAVLISLYVLPQLSTPVYAAGNPRYAALVLDADSGQVLFEAHAREKRYPASLTKMMTLYMVFDALESGKWTLNKKLVASKKAASQPQTNIALRAGDQITVEQSIKALVTRSANDVAVVLAESLGKTDWNFGVMMTNKARALGMKNSVFRNPNGLPDSRQYTTAYDMAVLGVALRRDFPQYFSYFNTRSFTYKGRTYGSHNRVLDRFPGVDGIKTGFINASGFNLVSSVKRDGITMVAVVMGGVTAASRDNHMVELLKKHFTQLAEAKKNANLYASKGKTDVSASEVAVEVPAPKFKPTDNVSNVASLVPASGNEVTSSSRPAPVAALLSSSAIDARVQTSSHTPRASIDYKAISGQASGRLTPALSPSGSDAAAQENAQKINVAPLFDVSFISTAKASESPRKGTLDYQYALLDTDAAPAETPRAGKGWGIQVGAFRSEDQARDAVSRAIQMVEGELKNAYTNITSDGQRAAAIHRARLGNLSKAEAENACRKLNALNSACFPLRIN